MPGHDEGVRKRLGRTNEEETILMEQRVVAREGFTEKDKPGFAKGGEGGRGVAYRERCGRLGEPEVSRQEQQVQCD